MEKKASAKWGNLNEKEAKERIKRNCRQKLDDPDQIRFTSSQGNLIFVFPPKKETRFLTPQNFFSSRQNEVKITNNVKS